MANKQLAEKLKKLRMKNKLTQKDVYEQLGISQSTFSSWEVGKSEPDAITFLKLCKIYNVNDILLEFTGESTSNETSAEKKMFDMLDSEDRAEIRGEMKQMLKAPKYQTSTETMFNDIAEEISTSLSTPVKNKIQD